MLGLVVVGLIVEEIWNVDVNCAKVTAERNIGQGICRVSTSGTRTLQGLVVVSPIVEKISNVDTKCVKVTGA